MAARRFVLEAEWSGYVSRQQHVVHREAFAARPKLRKAFEAIQSIRFTDGTLLFVRVRDAKPREKVATKLGYRSVLHGAAARGLTGFGIDVRACNL